MGAGASSASPQDVILLNECLNASKARFRDDTAVIIDDLQNSLLGDLSPDRLVAFLPVLQAAISKYSTERVNNISHSEASEAALVAGRAVFSAGKTLRPVLSPLPSNDSNQVKETMSEFNKPIPLAPTFPPTPGPNTTNDVTSSEPSSMTTSGPISPKLETEPTDDEKKKWRTPRPRGRRKIHRGNPVPLANVMLSGLRSSYEDAEIGGGTMYTTEVSLYEDGTAEVGNHDIGQRGRKVHRRQRRGDGFSDALFWGGYEYYDGTWKLIEDSKFGQNRYLVTLTKLSTQPSDPYNSSRGERDISASMVLTEIKDNSSNILIELSNSSNDDGEKLEMKKEDEESSNQGAAEKEATEKQQDPFKLVMSDIKGEVHIKFEELRHGEKNLPSPTI